MTTAPTRQLICRNRRARYDYEIEETVDAGLVLTGSEVKALRQGKAQLRDSYATIRRGEIWLLKAHISPYEQANRENHDPERERKLLLHRREIDRLQGKLRNKGLTLIPVDLFFEKSWAKVTLGLARGKRAYDKRHAIAERDADRRLRAVMRDRQRR
jgi:SsrA-binding protein